jgi:hypothetical protein
MKGRYIKAGDKDLGNIGRAERELYFPFPPIELAAQPLKSAADVLTDIRKHSRAEAVTVMCCRNQETSCHHSRIPGDPVPEGSICVLAPGIHQPMRHFCAALANQLAQIWFFTRAN